MIEINKTYQTKLATGEHFTVHRVDKNNKGEIIRCWGIYENSPHLLNCPINVERLITEI